MLTVELHANNAYLRGGIACGWVYHHVFGTAYQRAFELKQTVANYPLVVVDQALVPRLLESGCRLSIREEDGVWSLALFSPPYWPRNLRNRQDHMRTVRQGIVNDLDAFKGNVRIRDKYAWLTRQFNMAAAQHANN